MSDIVCVSYLFHKNFKAYEILNNKFYEINLVIDAVDRRFPFYDAPHLIPLCRLNIYYFIPSGYDKKCRYY